jgi:galactokinase
VLTDTSRQPPASAAVQAFAPGRVNLIGEHTDYNNGLALPFAIAEGVTVSVRVSARSRAPRPGSPGATETPVGSSGALETRIGAHARDLGEHDEFTLPDPAPADDWRAFVRGMAAELSRAGVAIPDVEIEIAGSLPRGTGLSSSAALTVALGLALNAIAGRGEPDRRELAQLCARVENEWVGARTGLLDQLASLFGEPDAALLIDFATLAIAPVPLVLEGGWRLVTLDSGDSRALAASGYNERRAECARACRLLGVQTLRDLERTSRRRGDVAELPGTLARRVRHVLGENARVAESVTALRAGDLARVGALLDESHVSLREDYECSTPAVEATVRTLKQAGAVGARLVGGGFGGSVLGLLPPGTIAPAAARAVRPARGAHLLG